MFATLLMEEARTQARRNAGVAGIMAVIAAGFMLLSLLELPVLSSTLLVGAFVALVAMPAVVSIQIGIAALASAAVATLLVAGWSPASRTCSASRWNRSSSRCVRWSAWWVSAP